MCLERYTNQEKELCSSQDYSYAHLYALDILALRIQLQAHEDTTFFFTSTWLGRDRKGGREGETMGGRQSAGEDEGSEGGGIKGGHERDRE